MNFFGKRKKSQNVSQDDADTDTLNLTLDSDNAVPTSKEMAPKNPNPPDLEADKPLPSTQLSSPEVLEHISPENDVTEDNRVGDWVHHLNYLEFMIPPRPRQTWEQITSPCGGKMEWVSSLSISKERRSATPSDLVLDLVYVILLQQLGRAYRSEVENNPLNALRDFVALFTPIWFQWNVIQHYLNRYEQKDVVHVIFFLGNIICMANIGISAEACGSGTVRHGCSEFAWSFAGARLWVLLFEAYSLYFNWNTYRLSISMFMIPDVIAILVWFIVGFLPAGEECGSVINMCWFPFIFFWWFGIFVDMLRLLAPMIVFRILKMRTTRKESVPLNVNLIGERNELFIIISIGEIIAASLASDAPSAAAASDDDHGRFLEGDDTHHAETISAYRIVPLVVLIAALVKITYFDVAEHPAPSGGACMPRKHAMTRSPWTGLAWVMLHLPLNISIVLLGAILEPLKLHGEFNGKAQVVCSNCLAGIVLICSLFDVLHSGGNVQLRRVKKQARLGFHLLCVLSFFVVPYFKDFAGDPLEYLGIVNALLLVQVAGTIYAHFPIERPGEE
ncbi:hypothetical protein TrVE_jg9922 [Triparma verrucosa]|uniref:Transmembrane protein n=1 Tax=Triparma verrucosa TaxID=1606542 RepID=A0A9W7C7T7_9STRA|nr:hypothetical protein TrVE_jg9922 [Triparma verrucosa]